MGLTIHYNGKFNPLSSLNKMIDEVADIAQIHNWKHTVFETSFPERAFNKKEFNNKIYGLFIIPPNCEPFNFTFLSNGRMASPAGLEFWSNYKNDEKEKYLYMLSTKTQFAGSELHKLIIHLLKYLRPKYFSELNVIDEGKYWETEDDKLLESTFAEYNSAIDIVSAAIENIRINPGETYDEYFDRILNRKKNN
ncbi:MAG: hypothetical protein K9J16_10415 [Melioribacteraceae bacterium]|nr:hypothetical protein [Melioribacteraceae bacterium]MCF8354971.1 hypothetical protein [Melioribacteraceae bacterium]MCF8394012.1 hypothetical protein [Melioribacteraceae bacterium]MCF8419785.1 hypothetical protein [Melioribacteraceae bacterium]